jgi:hypothetical protein
MTAAVRPRGGKTVLMRKLLVVVAPALLCVPACALLRWTDELMPPGGFWQYLLKGLTLGVCAALVLPAAGISAVNNGLTAWLFAAAGLLLLALAAQYLQTVGLLREAVLAAVTAVNGQVGLAEGTLAAFSLVTALLHLRRRGG